MKCPYCGAPIGIEDEYCAYCGQKNLMTSKHQEEMQHYKNEFAKTQHVVYEKTRYITSLTVPLIFLTVMIILNIAALIFLGKSSDIGYSLLEANIEKNADTHLEKIEEYLEHRDYIGFYQYFSRNDLYFADVFDDYSAIENASGNLSSLYTMVTEIASEPGSYYLEEDNINYTLKSIARNVEDIFSIRESYSYNTEAISGEFDTIIDDIEIQTKALLVAYCGLTREEADELPNLSLARQYEVLERGLARL